MVNDYSKGKIYKLWSPSTDLVYIGSTIQTLKRRLSGHKGDAKNGRSCSSKRIIAFNDYEIKWLEDYPCKKMKELNKREGIVSLDYPTRVNKQVAGRTDNEYWNDRYKDPVVKKARQAQSKEYRATPEAKKTWKTYMQRPEVKEAAKIRRNTPEEKQRIKEYETNYKARRSELRAEKRAAKANL
jgi:hypothetical protein